MSAPGVRLLVLWCPDWPVLAHARDARLPAEAPIALREKGRVLAANAAARAEGVRMGMRQREAQASCPELRLLDYDHSLDARAFEPLLAELEATLPGLHPLRPGLVAVRARGAARYYGGERAAARAMLAIADRLEVPAVVGVADGLFAAELAARRAPAGERILVVPPGGSAGFLAPLPVAQLGDAELASLLPRLGIRTLGDFAALPAEEVAARLGPEGARRHALAGGQDARPATPRIPPRDRDVAVDFEPPLERADQVAFAMRVAADDLLAGLLAERLVCTALRVVLTGAEGESSERVWLHPASFSPAEIVDRVRWSLDGASEAVHGLRSPVARVRLSPEAVDPAAVHERGLWGTAPDERLHSGVARVQGMVGHAGVLTAIPSGGRSPEERRRRVPWGDRPTAVRDPRPPWPGAIPPPAPATVYELPRELRVEDALGRPVSVDARGSLSASPAVLVAERGGRRELTAWAGPWPLDERWWDAEAARRVHRFQVVDARGDAWLLELDESGAWWAVGRYD